MPDLLIHILIGCFSIAVGVVIKANPRLIAGYGQLSGKAKKEINISGLSSFMRNGFVITGCIIIIVSVVLYLTGNNRQTFLLFVILVTGALITGMLAGKFDRGETAPINKDAK